MSKFNPAVLKLLCNFICTTLCPKKRSHFYFFLNNFVENEPILIIFGTLNPEGT